MELGIGFIQFLDKIRVLLLDIFKLLLELGKDEFKAFWYSFKQSLQRFLLIRQEFEYFFECRIEHWVMLNQKRFPITGSLPIHLYLLPEIIHSHLLYIQPLLNLLQVISDLKFLKPLRLFRCKRSVKRLLRLEKRWMKTWFLVKSALSFWNY